MRRNIKNKSIKNNTHKTINKNNKSLDALNSYYATNKKLFLSSIKFDSTFIRLILTDMGFIATLIISYAIIYLLWFRQVMNLSKISLMVTSLNPDNIDSAVLSSSWNNLILMIIVIFLLGLISYILLLAIYSAVSHIFLTNNNFKIKTFINFIIIYLLITISYIISIIMASYFGLTSGNIVLTSWIVILLSLLYLYLLFIYYLVTDNSQLSKIFMRGIIGALKFYKFITPTIIGLIMITLLSLIVGLLYQFIPVISSILALIGLLYIINFIKRYSHNLLHE